MRFGGGPPLSYPRGAECVAGAAAMRGAGIETGLIGVGRRGRDVLPVAPAAGGWERDRCEDVYEIGALRGLAAVCSRERRCCQVSRLGCACGAPMLRAWRGL